ncbi:hypothetical protein CERSUDRAFT_120401, partial [Gelatoporia subvermispora B]
MCEPTRRRPHCTDAVPAVVRSRIRTQRERRPQDLYSRRVNRRRCAREHGDSGICTCTTTCPPCPCRPGHRRRTAWRPALLSQRRLEDRRAPSISAGRAEAGEMKQKG